MSKSEVKHAAAKPERRLGRGLASLMGDTAFMFGDEEQPSAAASQPTGLIAVARLAPGPFQPRQHFDPEQLAELVSSIKLRGVLQPVLVRPDPTDSEKYQIIAGERRWRASVEAGLHEIPCFIRNFSDAEAMAASLIENLQRQNLNVIEEAEGYKRLIQEFSMTQDELGDAIGKSRSYVANTLRLLTLSEPVLAEVKKGSLSAGHARALLSCPDPEKALKAVLSRGLNVRQTEALSRKKPAPEAPEKGKTGHRGKSDTIALENQLSERLGLRVKIEAKGKAGELRISYSSLDQLDSVLDLLMA